MGLNISSVTSVQQHLAKEGIAAALRTEQLKSTGDGQAVYQGPDTVQISQAGMAAYLKKKAEESPEYKNAIRELSSIEDKVLAHEQAHMNVGGDLAGSASYSYSVGPDGKRYITGGEVPISMPNSGDKEKMLADLEQVKKAALAPAEPSSQDLSVAAEASAQAIKIRGELASEKIKEEQLVSERPGHSNTSTTTDKYTSSLKSADEKVADALDSLL